MRKIFYISLTVAIISWGLFLIISYSNSGVSALPPPREPNAIREEPTDWKGLTAIAGIISASTAFLAKAFEIIKYFIKKKSEK